VLLMVAGGQPAATPALRAGFGVRPICALPTISARRPPFARQPPAISLPSARHQPAIRLPSILHPPAIRAPPPVPQNAVIPAQLYRVELRRGGSVSLSAMERSLLQLYFAWEVVNLFLGGVLSSSVLT
jgi:hypothetical protein